VTLRDGAEALRCEVGRIDRPLAGDSARLLLTATPVEREAPLGPLLSERFGLTASEARLAGHLASGRDLRAAAEAMGVSRHTARKYLQIAFSKMGVRRQADLVRRVLETARAEAG
jgi:DNA-binding CsgD family transcriptional regulator